jgi:hypothetical protein
VVYLVNAVFIFKVNGSLENVRFGKVVRIQKKNEVNDCE